MVLTACLYLFLHSEKLLDQLDDENKEMAEPRPEESLDTLLGVFFVSVFLFYFGLQSVEVVFNQQIYTYARCTGSSRPEATQLNPGITNVLLRIFKSGFRKQLSDKHSNPCKSNGTGQRLAPRVSLQFLLQRV